MNQEWVRGGAAIVCLAAIGGLIAVGLGGGGEGASGLIRALSIVAAIVGLLFIAFGVIGKPKGR